MKNLNNKAVVITGGAGGIGSITAKKFAEEGAKVLLVDINEEDLKDHVNTIGKADVYYQVADVTKEEDVKKYVDKAEKLFGNVDIFFNNAGIEGKVAPLENYPMEEFNKVMDVNVKGVYLGLRYMFPLMKKNENGGSIIITSSVAGMMGTANVLPYVTSKHALIGMMRSAALEGAPNKLRVNSVNPSPVDNRMMRSLESGFAPGEAGEAKKNFENMIPLGRYAKNEEIADLVLFLGSDESKFITGTINPVDGGMTA